MDECNQTNSLLDISCIHTHVLRFEHLIEHVGSLLGEEKKKGELLDLQTFISRNVQFLSFPTTNKHAQ
jgi:hypothetical protein